MALWGQINAASRDGQYNMQVSYKSEDLTREAAGVASASVVSPASPLSDPALKDIIGI